MRNSFVNLALAGVLVCLCSCGKSESQERTSDPSAGGGASTATPASPPVPVESGFADPPEWLKPALFGSFDDSGYDRALKQITDVPDHAEQIISFAQEANDSLCLSLVYIVAALAERSQDPKYLQVAAALSDRLDALQVTDAGRMLVPMLYPPEVVGTQMLSALHDDSLTALDQCGAVNWLSEWNRRDPQAVAGIIDSSADRLRQFFEASMRHSDRDHGALGLVVTRTLRECKRITREESLQMLDEWQSHYGHIAGFATMHDRIRQQCDQPDK